jgi:hypothetical protein
MKARTAPSSRSSTVPHRGDFLPAGTCLHAYGARNAALPFEESSHFEDQKVGGSIGSPRLAYALRYFRTGARMTERCPGAPDDTPTPQAPICRSVRGSTTLVIGVTEMSFDSNLPGFDRDVTAVRTRLNFGGDFGPF